MNVPSISSLPIPKIIDVGRLTGYVVPVAAIVASLAVLLLVVRPKFTQVLSLRSANKELAVRAEALAVKAQLLASVDKVELDSQFGLAEQMLPSDKAVFAFIRQVETTASANGVILEKVDVVPGSLNGQEDGGQTADAKTQAKSEAAPKVQAKIAILGDYRSAVALIEDLLATSRVVGISELSLVSASTESGSGLLRATILLDAYWKPLPTTLGSIEQPLQSLDEQDTARLDKVAALQTSGGASATVPPVPLGRSDLFAPF